MLNIAFVGDRKGQETRMEGVNEQTTLKEVAQNILQFLGAGYAKLSFVAEFGNAIKIEVNSKEVINYYGKDYAEAITGFYSTGLSCKVKASIQKGNILIWQDISEGRYIEIPLNVDESVLDLKRKISQKTSICVEKQRLEYQQKVLQNENEVGKCNIQEGSQI
ncbi:MAG: hypothetical protein EZS28_054529, partial [Streblomastix strix]